MTYDERARDDDGVSGGRLTVVLATLVLLSVCVGPAAGAGSAGPALTGGSFHGDGVATTRGNTTYLWQSEPQTLTVDVEGEGNVAGMELCVATTPVPNGSSHQLTCQPVRSYGTNRISIETWPPELTGQQRVSVVLRSVVNDTRVFDRTSLRVHVMTRTGDVDEDGLTNEREFAEKTDFLSSDTDTDGVTDGQEVTTYGTNATDPDTDGDGLRDNAEINGGTNVTVGDTDGDGLLDGDEVNQVGTDPLSKDTDGDGLDDPVEVNRAGTDPRTEDTDGDGLLDGDEVNQVGTDPLSKDTDDDGLSDGDEVDRVGTDPLARDTDGDVLSDGTERRLGTSPTSAADVLVIGLLVTAIVAVVVARTDREAVRERLSSLAAAVEGHDAERDAARGPAEGNGTSAAPATDGHADTVILTDEDRVLKLLREHGGPMPQKELAEETDWSASKVSRLLSSMEEDGEITKITIGRENVITLGGDGHDSPFDREE